MGNLLCADVKKFQGFLGRMNVDYIIFFSYHVCECLRNFVLP